MMADHVHKPGPESSIDTYIHTAKCLICGLDLYFVTPAFETLGTFAQRNVLRKIQKLQNDRQVNHIPDSNIPVVKTEAKEVIEVNKETAKITDVDELPPIPERPANKAPMTVNQYYVKNTPLILRYIEKLGQVQTREAWGFSGIAWDRFCLRNKIIKESHRGSKSLKHYKRPSKEKVKDNSQMDNKKGIKNSTELNMGVPIITILGTAITSADLRKLTSFEFDNLWKAIGTMLKAR